MYPTKNPLFLETRIGGKIRVLFRDYFNFLAFLVFIVINISLGRVLALLDRRFKTDYLGKLIRFFEYFA